MARQLATLSQLWPFPRLLLLREPKAHPAACPRLTPLHSLELLLADLTLDACTDVKSEIAAPREAFPTSPASSLPSLLQLTLKAASGSQAWCRKSQSRGL